MNSVTSDKVLGRKMAKAAAIGAVIAIPVPFVGPIIGAAAGAGYAYLKAKKGR
jgi:predicted PurR-regulated permease PerM